MAALDIDLDALIEAAELAGMAGTVPTRRLHAINPRLAAVAGRAETRTQAPKPAPWSPEDDQYLAANLGYLAESDIAQALGRTTEAVHLRWSRDLRLPPPSKMPGWLTANRAAWILGIDGHAVMRLIRAGVLPAEQLPWLHHGLHATYRLRLVTFRRWAIHPRHWIYFRPTRVRDPHLRRLLKLKAARWGDAWLTPGQVAALHGVDSREVNRFIHLGRLPAVRWNNWRILRSDAERVRFIKGRGHGHERAWSPAADAFMLLARAIGLSGPAIAALTHLPSGTVYFRLQTLQADPAAVASTAQRHGLALIVRTDGQLFADWRLHRRRFPAVARAMDRFAASLTDPAVRLTPAELNHARGVLWSWANWRAATDAQRDLAARLTYAGKTTPARLRAALAQMRAWGIDPLAPFEAAPATGEES